MNPEEGVERAFTRLIYSPTCLGIPKRELKASHSSSMKINPCRQNPEEGVESLQICGGRLQYGHVKNPEEGVESAPCVFLAEDEKNPEEGVERSLKRAAQLFSQSLNPEEGVERISQQCRGCTYNANPEEGVERMW